MPSPEAIGFPSAAWGAIVYRVMLGNGKLPGYGTKGHALRRALSGQVFLITAQAMRGPALPVGCVL
jgi:hypothetical protein